MDGVWPSSDWIIALGAYAAQKLCVHEKERKKKKRTKSFFIHIIISSPFPLVKRRTKNAIIIKTATNYLN